jgi:aminoglycoside 3-N-acetyltransferase
MDDHPLTTAQLVADLEQLGVRAGSVLCVHTSLRAVGRVADGPSGVIRALRARLGATGTLVMPSMTGGATPYDPRATPTRDMGIVAETFWRLPGVLRSTHPSSAFAAAGPLAIQITQSHPLEHPQGLDSPIGKVYQHHGWVLLLGVEQDSNTMLHLAEALSNVPYRRIARVRVREAGVERWVEFAEIDHCCQNFGKIAEPLRTRRQLRSGKVGRAQAHLMRARDVVQVACDLLAADPFAFLCPPGQCQLGEECDEARAYARVQGYRY